MTRINVVYKVFGIDKMFNDVYEGSTFKSLEDATNSLRSNEWVECIEIDDNEVKIND